MMLRVKRAPEQISASGGELKDDARTALLSKIQTLQGKLTHLIKGDDTSTSTTNGVCANGACACAYTRMHGRVNDYVCVCVLVCMSYHPGLSSHITSCTSDDALHTLKEASTLATGATHIYASGSASSGAAGDECAAVGDAGAAVGYGCAVVRECDSQILGDENDKETSTQNHSHALEVREGGREGEKKAAFVGDSSKSRVSSALSHDFEREGGREGESDERQVEHDAAGPPDLARLWGINGVVGKEARDEFERREGELLGGNDGWRRGDARGVLMTLMSEGTMLLDFLGMVNGGCGETGEGESRRKQEGEQEEDFAEKTSDIRHVSLFKSY